MALGPTLNSSKRPLPSASVTGPVLGVSSGIWIGAS